jgi:hypothetical protein
MGVAVDDILRMYLFFKECGMMGIGHKNAIRKDLLKKNFLIL